MRELPAVSVLLPVHDAAATLAACLGSLRAQSLRSFEVVLVDDGSRDRSAELARRAWGRDPRLRVLRPGRIGLVAALRLGLEACRAELVARMDADDVAAPERLALQHGLLLREPDVSVVGSLVRIFSHAAPKEGLRLYAQWLNGLVDQRAILRERFVESPLAHPSVMLRRRAILDLGGYRDMGWPEDYDLWLRAAERGLRFAKIERVLLHWRDREQRHSRTHPRYARDAFLRCKAHHLARGPLAQHAGVMLWGAGRNGRRLSRLLAAEGVRTLGFVDIDPRLIGRKRLGAPVLAPGALGPPRGRVLVAAVGTRGARPLIRKELVARGWSEGVDCFFAA